MVLPHHRKNSTIKTVAVKKFFDIVSNYICVVKVDAILKGDSQVLEKHFDRCTFGFDSDRYILEVFEFSGF